MTIVTTTIERQEDRIVVKRPGTEGAETIFRPGDEVESALRRAYQMGRSDARLEVSAVLRGLMGQ